MACALTGVVEGWLPDVKSGGVFGVGEDEREYFIWVSVKECLDFLQVAFNCAAIEKVLIVLMLLASRAGVLFVSGKPTQAKYKQLKTGLRGRKIKRTGMTEVELPILPKRQISSELECIL